MTTLNRAQVNSQSMSSLSDSIDGCGFKLMIKLMLIAYSVYVEFLVSGVKLCEVGYQGLCSLSSSFP
ncbi:hypothetical protein NC651_039535 [Populus alba x Populus x berolinensis]|nr:hypothetical protein NC651_039535 [Populus alba x Populus x berolinensis]